MSRSAIVSYEHVDLSAGDTSEAITLSYSQPFGKRRDYSIQFKVPITTVDSRGDDAFGLSDGSIQLVRARGEEVVSSTGVPVRLSRPLDFLVVADHAEGLGLMFQVQEGNPGLVSDPQAAQWSKVLKSGTPEEKAAAQSEVTKAQAMGTLPAPLRAPKVVGPIMKSVWQEYTATAEKFNEPGRFTAMIGYAWTSVPGGNNLHRNVLFRDGKDKADR